MVLTLGSLCFTKRSLDAVSFSAFGKASACFPCCAYGFTGNMSHPNFKVMEKKELRDELSKDDLVPNAGDTATSWLLNAAFRFDSNSFATATPPPSHKHPAVSLLPSLAILTLGLPLIGELVFPILYLRSISAYYLVCSNKIASDIFILFR